MPRPKDKPSNHWAEFELNDEAFIRLFLKEVDELQEEAGDWRDHLPYEALVGFHRDSAIRERFKDHFTACAYCQELAETLLPDDKTRPILAAHDHLSSVRKLATRLARLLFTVAA